MPAGRPTKYKPEYAEQAFKLCLLGHTDKELAKYFEVSEVTINAWKKEFPQFLKSLKKGKDEADANVAFSMYRRACGIEMTLTDTHENSMGTSTSKRQIYIPPDGTTGMKWLQNRQPAKWRNNPEGGSGDDDRNFTVIINGQKFESE